MKLKLLLLSFILIVTGCSSTTIINSDPQGATLYIDGFKMGKTPYTYTDSKTNSSTTSIFLTKEGFIDKHIVMNRSERMNYFPLIGAIYIAPLFWIRQYDSIHNFVLEKKLTPNN